MTTYNSLQQDNDNLIQQLQDIAYENKCNFDYDEIPYQESINNLLDNYKGEYDSDESTVMQTDNNELEYTKKIIRTTIIHFKKKVIVYCVKMLNCLGKKHKLKFHVPKIKSFIRNVSVKDNKLLLGMTLHKILLKYDNECLSNKNAIELSESFPKVYDFLNKTFEQLIIKYGKSHAFKNHIKILEIKNKKFLTLFQAFGNEQHILFYPKFIRNNHKLLNKQLGNYLSNHNNNLFCC